MLFIRPVGGVKKQKEGTLTVGHKDNHKLAMLEDESSSVGIDGLKKLVCDSRGS